MKGDQTSISDGCLWQQLGDGDTVDVQYVLIGRAVGEMTDFLWKSLSVKSKVPTLDDFVLLFQVNAENVMSGFWVA